VSTVDPIRKRLGWSLVNGTTALATSTLTLLLVSRRVDPGEYGRVAVILATWGILVHAIIWCGSVVLRFGPEELHAQHSLGETVGTRLVFAVPVLLLVVGAPPFLIWVRGWSVLLALMTAGWLIVSTAFNVLDTSGAAAQRFRILSLSNVIIKGAPLAVIGACFVHPFFIRAEQLVASTLAGTLVSVLVLSVVLGPLFRHLRVSKPLLRRMWSYSQPLLAGMPAVAAISWMDPLVLDHFASHAEVGRYQLAYPTTTVFAMVGASLNSVLSPELVRLKAGGANDDVLARYRDRQQPRIAIVLALLGFGGACIAQPLVRFILPESYAETATLVSLLSVGGAFLLAGWTLLPLVTATDRTRSHQASNVLQALVNLGGDFVLGHRFGARGVALANILAWATSYVSLTLLLSGDAKAVRWTMIELLLAGAALTALLWFPTLRPAAPFVGIALLAAAALGLRQLWRGRRAATAR
jgi:O-antigen/teichoic acid export membrane protein